MHKANDLDPKESLSHLMAFYLVKYREMRGMTQSELAEALSVSRPHLSNLDRARKRLTITQAETLDDVFDLPAWFTNLHHHAQGEHRDWFVQYAAQELEAEEIKAWQPLWLPGLVQTPEYARAALEGGHADGVDAKIKSRVDRQEVLDRPNPPYLWVMIDEKTLLQSVGGPQVMREQIDHLLTLSRRPSVTIQIVPSQIGAHPGLDGGFNLLMTDSGVVAFAEAILGGRLVQDDQEVKHLGRTWDHIRSLALPLRETRKKLEAIAEERYT